MSHTRQPIISKLQWVRIYILLMLRLMFRTWEYWTWKSTCDYKRLLFCEFKGFSFVCYSTYSFSGDVQCSKYSNLCLTLKGFTCSIQAKPSRWATILIRLKSKTFLKKIKNFKIQSLLKYKGLYSLLLWKGSSKMRQRLARIPNTETFQNKFHPYY